MREVGRWSRAIVYPGQRNPPGKGNLLPEGSLHTRKGGASHSIDHGCRLWKRVEITSVKEKVETNHRFLLAPLVPAIWVGL